MSRNHRRPPAEYTPYGKGKWTKCSRGHPFDEENTLWQQRKDGRWSRICRACDRERNPFRARLYGLSLDAYRDILRAQHGRCAICGRPPGKRALTVDHNHATGQVRALLCNGCNVGIGGFREDPALLRAAIAYLETYRVTAGGEASTGSS